MSTADTRARFRAAMDLDEEAVHLNNAGVAPMLSAARTAIVRCAEQMSVQGSFAIDPLLEHYRADRASFARLVGVADDELAMAPTCAAAISYVAMGLDLRPGDQILRWDQEYPSNAYPWHLAARRSGAEVCLVESEQDLRLDTARMIAAIGPRTRVVAVSWVQWQTGAMTDLPALAEACRRHGAWLVVDAIQGLGAIPFDLAAMGVDAVCGGTHKWLCGPIGHGFVGFAPGRVAELTPVLQGAFTYGMPEDPVDPERQPRPEARRFEPGSPPFLGAAGGAASVEILLGLGIASIHASALELSDRLVVEVERRGARVLSATDRRDRSPVVTFAPAGPIEKALASLQAHRVACSQRAGAALRVAPHGFNSDADIDRLLAALDAA